MTTRSTAEAMPEALSKPCPECGARVEHIGIGCGYCMRHRDWRGSSDAPPVECSICLEMGSPRDPVCPGCIQIACDAMKTARSPNAPPGPYVHVPQAEYDELRLTLAAQATELHELRSRPDAPPNQDQYREAHEHYHRQMSKRYPESWEPSWSELDEDERDCWRAGFEEYERLRANRSDKAIPLIVNERQAAEHLGPAQARELGKVGMVPPTSKAEAAFLSAYAHFLRCSWDDLSTSEADAVREGCIALFEQVKARFKEARARSSETASGSDEQRRLDLAALGIAQHVVDAEMRYRQECSPGLIASRRMELEAGRSYWIDLLDNALKRRRERASGSDTTKEATCYATKSSTRTTAHGTSKAETEAASTSERSAAPSIGTGTSSSPASTSPRSSVEATPASTSEQPSASPNASPSRGSDTCEICTQVRAGRLTGCIIHEFYWDDLEHERELARSASPDASPAIETARERWLTTPLGSLGRKAIQVEQYEELRALACKALGIPFESHADVAAAEHRTGDTGGGK